MAREETDIVHRIMLATSPLGSRFFKNVRGVFFTKPEIFKLIDAVKRGDIRGALAAIKSLRQISAGLQAEGSSDLIGFRPVVITQAMVGQTVAVFSALEVKTADGAASPEQLKFVDFVRNSGGFAGIVRSADEAKEILKYPLA